MPADVVKLADDIVSLLQSNPLLAGYSISREYYVSTKIEDITGKNIWVFPVGYADAGPSDRTASSYDLTIGIVYGEKYDQKGKIPKAWTDERLQFVEEKLFVPLTDEHTGYGETGNYWSQSGSVELAFDPESLREHDLFWSELQLVYRKLK